ncbi:5-(carboxyamino)imidazole ribonucleotide synthase [Actinomyces oricola]
MSASIVAVIGGGQLARMMQEEASALGIRLRTLVEAADGSAAQVTVDAPVGRADDEAAVRRLVQGCGGREGAAAAPRLQAAEPASVLTFEHEHQDSSLLARLRAEGVSVQPPPEALLLARDKLAMRRALDRAFLPQPAWMEVSGSVEQMRRQVRDFAGKYSWPVVLKTPRGGYDGHGVLLVHGAEELVDGEAAQWIAAAGTASAGAAGAQVDQADTAPRAGGGGSLGGGAVTSLLLEQAVAFTRELSVLLARTPSGQVAAWPVTQTVQTGGMCAEVLAPAPRLSAEASARAQRIGRTVADRFGVTGVLAVELFAVEHPGEPARLFVNELAMRPHNSGHWTQDGCATSQFAQHVRAVLDLPLGSTEPTAPATVMVNLIGGAHQPGPDALRRAMALEPGARIHLYGKSHRPGRKLGHVNMTAGPGQDLQETLQRARAVVAILRGDASAPAPDPR